MIEVRKFENKYLTDWNEFLIKSKNASFLFNRNFMDYHADRFNDYSLMILKNNQLVACVPSNVSEDVLISHQGLSYGGIVLHEELKLVDIILIFKEILTYLKNNNINSFFLKLIPKIYNTRPCDELDWILFKIQAKIYRRDTALVIDNSSKILNYQERRKRAIKKAIKLNIEIREGNDQLMPFWSDVLAPNLKIKHGVKPVHSLTEIQLLANRFPDNIKQHNIYIDNKIVAGCTMFLNGKVAHAQYISGTQEGRELGGLDFLFDYLIKKIYSEYKYFDFGICNENQGQILNTGLLDWKEGFGARTIVHDFYEIHTANYHFLEEKYII